MIILEFESAILRNLLERAFDPDEHLSGTYNFNDFDGVRFKVSFPDQKGNRLLFLISMYLSCTDKIKQFGAEAAFKSLYGSYIVNTEAGFTHSIQIDLKGADEKKKAEVITLAARLKANILGAPILWVAERVAKKENFAPFEVPFRSNSGESLFISPADKGATAVFAIHFQDRNDSVIGSVFFGELQAAKTKVKNAPSVSYSNVPPREMENFKNHVSAKTALSEESNKQSSKAGEVEQRGRSYAFVSIGLLEPQLSDRKKQDTAYYVPLFRDYLQYHIKCAKAYLHLRMRARAALLLKALDAAKPEPKQKVRRTASGKIMT